MNDEIKGKLLKQEKLAKYTSWRVGGPAEQMFFPANRRDLLNFLSTLPAKAPIFWMGLGSNLLIRDGGISGTVINTRGRLKDMHLVGNQSILVESGVPCAHVAKFAAERGLTGAEFLAGIPGTMGGALKMNAGAFGGNTWNIVASVEMVNASGVVTSRYGQDFKIQYRSVEGRPNEWFLAATLALHLGETQASQEEIRALLAKRALTQPTSQATCGSVFKNPEHDYAARLIEACGLKGFAIGGAQVSEKHANFIINTGQATAAEIETLIAYVAKVVARKQGIKLQTEVCIVGSKETK